jgi:hypothetical protein
VISTPAAYLESPEVKYQPRDGLYWLGFSVVSLSLSRQRIVPQIRQQPLPSISFPIHYSLIILSTDAIDSIIK